MGDYSSVYSVSKRLYVQGWHGHLSLLSPFPPACLLVSNKPGYEASIVLFVTYLALHASLLCHITIT